MALAKKEILIVGAGRSSISLIEYLLARAEDQHWVLKVVDKDISAAKARLGEQKFIDLVAFDISDTEQLLRLITSADVVVSMLPAFMHGMVAPHCVTLKTPMVTASYVSTEIKKLTDDAKANGVPIVMEMGLDPGIDHMSAMRELDAIKEKGGEIVSFKSFTGGLIAPESDDNPWNYKFTWNPRNVVLAGQGLTQFIRNGKYKYIPYHNIFERTEPINVPGYGAFEGYPNRDSLKYRSLYGLQDIPTILRGTLRRPGFCAAWNVFVKLGLTDDSYQISNLSELTWRDFINAYLVYSKTDTIEEKLSDFFGIKRNDEVMRKLEWLGVFEATPIGIDNASPAKVLQTLLERKWILQESDKDMVVMQHQIEYLLEGVKKTVHASMVIKGENAVMTSMARTVGLPLGIMVKRILSGDFKTPGVHIPVIPEIYLPVLSELEDHGVVFSVSEK